MRVIISGIVGTTLAACIWMAAEHFTLRELGWLAIGVGVAAGFSVAPKDRARLSRAVLAVLLTAIACASARHIYALTLTAATNPAQAIQEPSKTTPAESADLAPAEEATATPPEKKPTKQTTTKRKLPVAKQIKPNWQSSQWDILWLAISCLVAYVIGKGSNNKSDLLDDNNDDGDESEIPADEE